MNKFDKIANRKASYKILSEKEKKIIKLSQVKDRLEKYFYSPSSGFYKNVKRKKTGEVDWTSLTKKELDLFDYQFKKMEYINKKLSNYSENEIQKAFNIFNQVNCLSVSY